MPDSGSLSNPVFKFSFKSFADGKTLQAKQSTEERSNTPQTKYTDGKVVSGKTAQGKKVKGKIIAIDKDKDGKEVIRVQILDKRDEEKYWIETDQINEMNLLKFEEFLAESTLNESATLPSNVLDWVKKQATSEQAKAAKSVAKWADQVGSHISGGTSIGKSPQGLVLDMQHQRGEIYVSSDGEIKLWSQTVKNFKEFQARYEEKTK